MAATKMSQLFIGLLVICFTLLPLVAARTVDIQTLKDAKVGTSRKISAEFVRQPPRGRAVFQVAVPSKVDNTTQSNGEKQMTDKEAQNIIKNYWGYNYSKNCSETDAAKQAIGAIFGKIIQRDLEFAHAIWEMIHKAIIEKEIAEMFECMIQEMLKKKQQQDEEEREALEAILKEMFKHKFGGLYDKEFSSGMGNILKEIFSTSPALGSKTATDKNLNMSSNCYATCTESYR